MNDQIPRIEQMRAIESDLQQILERLDALSLAKPAVHVQTGLVALRKVISERAAFTS